MKKVVSKVTRREQLQENIEDAIFALLMEDLAEQEGKRLVEENEQLKQDSSAKVPDALDKRCRKIIRQAYSRERRHEVGRVLHRILANAALAAMVCILLFVSAFAAVPEVRIMTLNLLIEVSDVSTSLRLTGVDNDPIAQNGNSSKTDDVQTLWGYRLPEIPDDYEVVYENSSDWATDLWYGRGDESLIKFNISKASETLELDVDTENAEVEKIQIHGYDGLLTEKGNRIDIIWGDTDQNNFVSITCTGIDQNTALDFAKEMEYCGQT